MPWPNRSAKHILQLKLWSAQRILILVILGCNLGTSWTMIKRQQLCRQCHRLLSLLPCFPYSYNLPRLQFICTQIRLQLEEEMERRRNGSAKSQVVCLAAQTIGRALLWSWFALWALICECESAWRRQWLSLLLLLLLPVSAAAPVAPRAAFVGTARLCRGLNLCTISPVECLLLMLQVEMRWGNFASATNSCVNFHFNCRLCIWHVDVCLTKQAKQLEPQICVWFFFQRVESVVSSAICLCLSLSISPPPSCSTNIYTFRIIIKDTPNFRRIHK